MATGTKIILSGSTNGRLIQVTAVATPGTLIHTTVAGAVNMDEIYLYAVNTDTTDREVVVEWGGAGALNEIPLTVRARSGLVLIVPGLPLQNSLVVRAYAAVANVINIGAFDNRITA